MQNRTEVLNADCTYHVYNRAHGNEKMFRSEDNYNYFLQQYKHYISPLVDTFCYCLMPNHFHFLIRCKNEKTIEEHFLTHLNSRPTLTEFRTLSGLDRVQNQKMLSRHLSLQFSHLFNSYTQAFNKQQKRKGG